MWLIKFMFMFMYSPFVMPSQAEPCVIDDVSILREWSKFDPPPHKIQTTSDCNKFDTVDYKPNMYHKMCADWL